MSAAAQTYDMGGTPRVNATIAVVMFATAATPQGEAAGRQYAGEITQHLLNAAATGGFKSAEEFRRLVAAGRLTRRLDDLAGEVVLCIGGAGKFFELLDLITTPAGMMGGAQ